MSNTTVTASGIIADLQPYIVTAIGVVIAAIGALISAQIRKYTGIAVDQATVDKVDKYIADKAAQAVAAAGDNLATHQINVGSPIVVDITGKIVSALPGELAAIGLTPEAVANKLAAAFGRLQAQMASVPVTPPKG